MDVGEGQFVGDRQPGFGLSRGQVQHFGRGRASLAEHKQIAPHGRELAQEKAHVHALVQNGSGEFERGQAVFMLHGFKEGKKEIFSGQPQGAPHRGHGQFFAAQGQNLAQKGHAVTDAAGGAFGDEAHGFRFECRAFLVKNVG